jgi:hypothetical protein
MKTYINNKKIYSVVLLAIIFFSSSIVARAVYQTTYGGRGATTGPSTPTTGLGGTFVTNLNAEEYITPGTTTPGAMPGRSLNINKLSTALYGLVSDGVYSFGPVRAVGKLTATLIPTTLTGYDAREVMSLKSGKDSGLISFLTNVSYLGFYSQSSFDPSMGDAIGKLVTNRKMITNLRFGRVNSEQTIVSPADPYANPLTKDLTLYGTTNIGRGDICYIPVPSVDSNTTLSSQQNALFRCPAGYFVKGPGKVDYNPGQVSNPSFNGSVSAIVCQAISPSTHPGSNATGNMNTFTICSPN